MAEDHPWRRFASRSSRPASGPMTTAIAALGDVFTDGVTVWSPNLLAEGLADLAENLASAKGVLRRRRSDRRPRRLREQGARRVPRLGDVLRAVRRRRGGGHRAEWRPAPARRRGRRRLRRRQDQGASRRTSTTRPCRSRCCPRRQPTRGEEEAVDGSYRLVIEDEPDPLDLALLEERLAAAAVASVGVGEEREFGIFARDDEGTSSRVRPAAPGVGVPRCTRCGSRSRSGVVAWRMRSWRRSTRWRAGEAAVSSWASPTTC